MRTLILAVSATALAVPVTFALPTEEAQAQRRYYRDGYYTGPTWRDRQGRYRCRRPNGIDHFDLTLTIHSSGGPRTQRMAFLRPGQLYDETVVPAALTAALASLALGDPESTVRVAAALLSWGDVAYASMS